MQQKAQATKQQEERNKNSDDEEDETADEAKARIEADRTAKVQAQIDRAAANATGVPW